MAENSKIEWTDHTFNPWVGCTKVSPGCDHCYAEGLAKRWAKRSGSVQWGTERRRTSAANWRLPLRWNAQAEREGRRYRVFSASLADVFDNQVPEQWRADLFNLIFETPHLDWLLLTKRIGNVEPMLTDLRHGNDPDLSLWDWLPEMRNLWLGATVVNQAEADRDIPKLLEVPARVRFLSIEPMLGPIDLERPRPGPDLDQGHGQMICQPWLIQSGIDWVICGGESGPGARPMHPDWVRSLRDQCASAGVPFMFKQWGEWREPEDGETFSTAMGRAQKIPAFIVARAGTVHCFENDQTRQGGVAMLRVGRRAAGRLLDGAQHDGAPA